MSKPRLSVIAELDHHKIEWEPAGESEIKCICPFHEDNSPSAAINVDTLKFNCFVCNAHGDFYSYLSKHVGLSRKDTIIHLADRYDILTDKTINASKIEEFHQQWDSNPVLLKELYNRGVTADIIRKYRLGISQNRITIPIKNRAGDYVNVRKYLPGAPGAQKLRNTRGFGQIRWYPIEQLSYDTIVLCGGEIKAIVAAEHLNKYNIGCITQTGSENNWEASLTDDLKNKNVIICYDIDDTGVQASDYVAQIIFRKVESVRIASLPLDIATFPHGDINDFVVNNGDLYEVITEAREWNHSSSELEIPFSDDSKPALTTPQDVLVNIPSGRRIKMECAVNWFNDNPMRVAKDVKYQCDRQQAECSLCPLYTREGFDAQVPQESKSLLDLVGKTGVCS